MLYWVAGLLLAFAVVRAALIRYDLRMDRAHPHRSLRPTGSPWDDRALYDCTIERTLHDPPRRV